MERMPNYEPCEHCNEGVIVDGFCNACKTLRLKRRLCPVCKGLVAKVLREAHDKGPITPSCDTLWEVGWCAALGYVATRLGIELEEG